MEAVTLSINGRVVSVRAGRTILEVARDQGIEIPTLCHADYLRPIGACRICQVEDKKRGMVVPSCVTKVAEGMEIETDSERVRINRRNIVRLLMSAHPESCLVCEKGNTCELRALAAKLGVGQHGLDPVPYHPRVEDRGPLMARDLSKCILCAKCLRADQDLVVEGVIDYNRRGFDAHPATLFSQPLETSDCTFCGTCLEVCPTGAIFEKNKPRISHWHQKAESVCPFCASGCGLSITHDGHRVLGVSSSDRQNGAGGHTLCVRGRFGMDYLSSPERITRPLARGENGFEPISWDAALKLAAGKLKGIQAAHGGSGLGFIGSPRCSNEENYLIQKLARHVFKTNNIDSASALDWAVAALALKRATGFAAGTCTLADLEKTNLVFLAGSDPASSAPLASYAIKRAHKNGARVVVLDSMGHRMAQKADLWLRTKPGGEQAALLGILKSLLEEGLADQEYVETKTKGFEELESSLAQLSLKELSGLSGVSVDGIRKTARLLAEADTACLVPGRELMGQRSGEEIMGLLLNLALATGNLGREGAGLLPICGHANSQGCLDVGVHPLLAPGHRSVEDPQTRNLLKRIWGAAPPKKQGLGYGAMIAGLASGIKGLFIMADDPVTQLPDRIGVTKALGGLEFLVVQDLFLTETARQAHLVLPMEAMAEGGGTVTSLERRVRGFFPLVMTPGDSPPAWQFLTRLAKALGVDWGFASTADVLAELEQAIPPYKGVAAADLAAKPSVWPLPGNEEIVDTLPHGIGLPDGRALFKRVAVTVPGEFPKKKGFPYLLVRGDALPHFGAGTRTGHSARLRKAEAEAWLGLSPADFDRLGVSAGQTMQVRSPLGVVEVPARMDGRLAEGVVFMPASFPETPVNALFEADWANPDEVRLPLMQRVSLRKLNNLKEA